jgi:plastocyanin
VRIRFRAMTALAVILVMTLSLIGYRNTQAAAPKAASPASVRVTIQNFAFSPASLNVAVGTTVTWTNKDSAAHTVTSDSNAWPDSGSLDTSKAFSFTFTKAGTFTYHCAIHPSMTATITVGGTSSGGSGSSGMMMMMGPVSKATMKTWTGYYDDKAVVYVSTDTSSKAEAASDHINYAPGLVKTLPLASKIYLITNGKFASRGVVFGSAPGEDDYTPLWQEVLVTWKSASSAVALGSDNQINALQKSGKVTLKSTNVVLNCPIVGYQHK